jgi:hypothetical protein
MKSSNIFTNVFNTKNVGIIDRLLRMMPAVIVSILVIQGNLSGLIAWVTGGLAAMLLVTSILGCCSIYYLLGVSSCRIHDSK